MPSAMSLGRGNGLLADLVAFSAHGKKDQRFLNSNHIRSTARGAVILKVPALFARAQAGEAPSG
jgi:hypothetical protein